MIYVDEIPEVDKIYQGQDAVRFEFYCNADIEDYKEIYIDVQLPDETNTTWIPEILDKENGVLFYDPKPEDIQQLGEYVTQPKIVYNNGKIGYGNADSFFIFPREVELAREENGGQREDTGS